MWFFTHVWIMPAVMAASFLVILLFGKRMRFKGAEVGITAVAAAEVGVGLAIVLLIYRNRRSVDIDRLDELKG